MKQRTRRRLQNIGVILLIAAALAWVVWRFAGYTSSTYTDNAQVRQLIVPVNSRVQGFVARVCFDDYQRVKKGDTLVIIDDADLRLQLAQARANLANATAGRSAMTQVISTTQNDLTVSDAALEEVRVRLANARRDRDRYAELLKQDAVTPQQYEAMATEHDALEAKYKTLLRQKQSTAITGREQGHRLDQNQAGIDLARAAVDLAELNLSYTVITAPCDGVTSRKQIQPGQLVQPGQLLVTVVDTADVWVTANYRETQTARMAVGDSVRINVDAIPGVTFTGYIESISQATGAQYSLVPQDNSSGNFVKVEQRVPVKIRFAPSTPAADMQRLRAGLNVTCKVLPR